VPPGCIEVGKCPDAARIDQFKLQRPDALEDTVQARLIQISAEHGDAAAGAHFQSAERRRGRRFVEPARYADLVAQVQSPASVSPVS
jgi:hypothetical protein